MDDDDDGEGIDWQNWSNTNIYYKEMKNPPLFASLCVWLSMSLPLHLPTTASLSASVRAPRLSRDAHTKASPQVCYLTSWSGSCKPSIRSACFDVLRICHPAILSLFGERAWGKEWVGTLARKCFHGQSFCARAGMSTGFLLSFLVRVLTSGFFFVVHCAVRDSINVKCLLDFSISAISSCSRS